MTDYIGRFAPSPTGPLHFGSLIAATASYLDARAHRGRWLLRIEDLDPPRQVAGSAQQIMTSLQAHGLQWDGPICWQSRCSSSYEAALGQLHASSGCYRCDCTRAKLAGWDGTYPGFCRDRNIAAATPAATRVKVGGPPIEFQDVVLGPQRQDPSAAGDFIVKRKDGLFAYQLAVVVDDAAAGVNHIIRGSDLLDSTARQIYLQRCLGLPTPIYGHLPLATNAQGQKLSKQNLAEALDSGQATANLLEALRFLGQEIPPQAPADPAGLLDWAASRWRRQRIPRHRAIVYNDPRNRVQ